MCEDEFSTERLRNYYEQEIKGKDVKTVFHKSYKVENNRLNSDELHVALKEILQESYKEIKKKVNSGEISYQKYKMAIAKARKSTNITLSLKVKGY